MVLHDDVLAYSGGSWDAPPAKVEWNDDHRRRRDEILNDYEALPAKLFGFKDPRTLLVLDGWLEVLEDCRMVGTYRHPSAVAMSLNRRDGFELERGFDLWVAYNRLLSTYRESHGFDLVMFDVPQHEYELRVDLVARRLGLQSPTGGFSFFDPILRKQEQSNGRVVPEQALALYDSLRKNDT